MVIGKNQYVTNFTVMTTVAIHTRLGFLYQKRSVANLETSLELEILIVHSNLKDFFFSKKDSKQDRKKLRYNIEPILYASS